MRMKEKLRKHEGNNTAKNHYKKQEEWEKCVCVCVCVCERERERERVDT